MTVGLPLVSDIAETPRVTIVDSKYTADGKVEPQQRMSPKGKQSVKYINVYKNIVYGFVISVIRASGNVEPVYHRYSAVYMLPSTRPF